MSQLLQGKLLALPTVQSAVTAFVNYQCLFSPAVCLLTNEGDRTGACTSAAAMRCFHLLMRTRLGKSRDTGSWTDARGGQRRQHRNVQESIMPHSVTATPPPLLPAWRHAACAGGSTGRGRRPPAASQAAPQCAAVPAAPPRLPPPAGWRRLLLLRGSAPWWAPQGGAPQLRFQRTARRLSPAIPAAPAAAAGGPPPERRPSRGETGARRRRRSRRPAAAAVVLAVPPRLLPALGHPPALLAGGAAAPLPLSAGQRPGRGRRRGRRWRRRQHQRALHPAPRHRRHAGHALVPASPSQPAQRFGAGSAVMGLRANGAGGGRQHGERWRRRQQQRSPARIHVDKCPPCLLASLGVCLQVCCADCHSRKDIQAVILAAGGGGGHRS